MIAIVLAILLGIIFTFLAVQNPTQVPLRFLDAIITLPLYVIAAFSFLGGIAITLVSSLFDSTAFDLRKKDNQVQNLAKSNQSLQYQIQKIATENEHLKAELHNVRREREGARWNATKERIKNFFTPARQHAS